jgi:hypothetical protein
MFFVKALQQKSLDNVNTIHSVLKKLIKKFRDNLLENVKTT